MENEKKENGIKKTKKPRGFDQDDGFNKWGGYKAAKRAKLMEQFKDSEIPRLSNIFEGVAIQVNGLTRPPMDQLQKLMAAHGGLFHMYQVSSTTHIIASNLPNVKIKHLGNIPVVKPSWITESIDFGKLLDYRRYLLYTNQSKTQPKIDFPVVEKTSTTLLENMASSIEKTESTINSTNQNSVPAQICSNLTENDSSNKSIENSCMLSNLQINSNKSVYDQNTRFPTKTASDPNFLEEFYNNSRLHLISTLGAEFKQLVGQMREKSDGKFPGKDKLLALKANSNPVLITNSVVMHIDMDCFFVSVSLRNHPELKGKPVAITHARNGQLTNVRPDQKANREQEFSLYSERLPIGVTSRVDKIDTQSSMSEIASCSYEARKCGIKNGMFLGQAVKMCPDLKTLPYDFEGIKTVSHALYETIASYTLDIEAVSCDEMYVDVTKILKDTWLSVEEWATYIRNEIMNVTRCPCSTGFGTNRLQARLATRKAKPAGQYYLKPDDVEGYMIEVPLADLPGVGRATLTKLQKLGLHTCGDVQLASLKVLQNEIGQKAGETLKEQSMGVDNRPLNFYHERKSVSAEINYGIRFQTIEECYNFLQNLSVEVCNRLNDINMRARCLTLKLLVRAHEAPMETAKFLGHGICDSLTKSTTSNIILNNPQIIFKEAKCLYEKLNPCFTDLRGVGLQLTKLERSAPLNKALSKFLNQHKSQENVAEKINKTIGAHIDSGTTDIRKSEESEKAQVKQIDDKSVDVTNKKQKEVSTNTSSSKRGRPRGSKSSVTTKSNKTSKGSITINNYFGKTKGIENASKGSKGSSVEMKIDMEVLNELPEDLRQEIIREYNIQDEIEQSCSQKNESQKSANKVVSQKNSNNETNPKSPFANLNWDQIKPIIRKWTESDDIPIDFDIEMIAEHFKQLAIDRQIDVLPSVFNFLHRISTGVVLNRNRVRMANKFSPREMEVIDADEYDIHEVLLPNNGRCRKDEKGIRRETK